jgi:nicotinamidase-related amidase
MPLVLAGLGIVALLLAAFAVVGLRSGAAGTRGDPIAHHDGAGTAVIVVDVQEDFTTWSGGRIGFQADVLERFFPVVNRVQAQARAQAVPVVHVRQEFEGLLPETFARLFVGGRGIAGRPGTGLDPRLEVAASDVELTKAKGDSFSSPAFDAFLRSRKVEHVVILGLDGTACVHATARGALNRGYRVSLVRDGILTSNPKKWNELLAALERDGVRVVAGDQLAEALPDPRGVPSSSAPREAAESAGDGRRR